MRDRDLLYTSKTVQVSFALEPIYNVITILEDLALCNSCQGMGEWHYQTADALPTEFMQRHRLIFGVLDFMFHEIVPTENCTGFSAYIEAFAAFDPFVLRDAVLERVIEVADQWADAEAKIDPPPSHAQLLSDANVYMRCYKSVYPDDFDDETIAEAHSLLNDPIKLHELAVQHMHAVWNEVLAPEWERVLPTLQASVAAFKKLDYSNLTLFEAIRAVTGRDVRAHWERTLSHIEKVIFFPTAHSGPYLNKFISGKTLRLAFTARLPKGIQTGSSTLTRAQLLIWLNALSDDSRLRILELLTHEDQLRAQDIIEQIGLSQSVISRHLSQLSATGYLIERREEGIKYYSLNLERLEETTNALLHFLRKK